MTVGWKRSDDYEDVVREAAEETAKIAVDRPERRGVSRCGARTALRRGPAGTGGRVRRGRDVSEEERAPGFGASPRRP
ncbi:hypothetical protein [Planomonospora parontospora]|uniref:hypothetical protein n=1 Tax=Planomonospora parontospora TaxID=58119 RepID=UPI00166F86F7|nr:hypothetical protein [Planomonospora parontospora]GGL29633.1 hypothetical protein GCM10014719_33800 [Planomonospora parontospora subsp. antibiotica]GII17798.1 hypothetical protein Ppa05_45240 [Planomonospora parontospora subsp. antibiotica]